MAPHASRRKGAAATSTFALTLVVSSYLVAHCAAHGHGEKPAHGLIGYGIPMYDPPCAFACRDAIAPYRLNCSTVEPKPRRHGGHEAPFATTPECFASDDSYLTSLAWCIQTRCDEIETWAIDKFWATDVIWNQPAEHRKTPKLGFHDALSQAGKAPTELMEDDEVSDAAKLVPDEDWDKTFAMVRTFARVETSNSKYGSLAGSTKLEAYALTNFIYPPLWGQRHLVPLPLDVGLLPTRGQMTFIAFQFFLNFALSIFGYNSVGPAWTVDTIRKLEFFANRVGILSFANLAVAILYATRNNPLVKLTGWSYSSFLLYHRWTAYLCVLQALIHSGIWLALHIHVLPQKFAQAYWTIGTLSMVAWCLMIPLSVLFVRRRYYEFFLNFHVLLASLSIVGCYYHIYFKFSHAYGYETWIYLASLIWAIERLVRLAKLAKNGIRRANIAVIDDEYIMVTIPGVKATGYAYLYFPSLSWRVWENHPFSISSSIQDGTALDYTPDAEGDLPFELVGSDSEASADLEKERAHDFDDGPQSHRSLLPDSIPLTPVTPQTPHSGTALLTSHDDDHDDDDDDDDDISKNTAPTSCLTFLIRREKGVTARLAASSSLPVLVETAPPPLSLNRYATDPHIVCVIGGAGITTVSPLLAARAKLPHARTALYWGCRSAALVRQVGVERLTGPGLDVNVRVGARWDVREVLQRETSGRRGEVVVIVSGPSGMADEVRRVVVEMLMI
ncbi:hypothetical protein ACHAQA_004982 [Verticillium albo-atrum]